mgnify:CR=1 FL=1
MLEYLELKLDAEQRKLDAQTRTKTEMKEWSERIPGQISEVQEQLSVAGPDARVGLTERLASLNSTLISVSKTMEKWLRVGISLSPRKMTTLLSGLPKLNRCQAKTHKSVS